ncbi:MAG: class I SAM-dependent methyltransferase [Dehalococcoidia bacterium]|jgi:SAM-dependent methyltransferase
MNYYCPKCKQILLAEGATYICNKCACKYFTVDGFPSFIDQDMSGDSFNTTAFKFLFEMEQKHFWHVGRKEIILDVIRRSITCPEKIRMLEIGCGNGNVLEFLRQNNINAEGCDLFLEGLKFCRQRSGSVPLYRIDVLALPFKAEYEAVGLFDVLEHIEDDVKALCEIHRALRPGGYLILTVPAYQSLWSRHDDTSHHIRRYSKKALMAKLEHSGFSVSRVTFFMFFLFPLLASIRLISRIFNFDKNKNKGINGSLEYKTIPVINDIFLALLRLEKYLIRNMDLPFGVSLIAVVRRD